MFSRLSILSGRGLEPQKWIPLLLIPLHSAGARERERVELVNAAGVPARLAPHVRDAPKIGTVSADMPTIPVGAEHGQDDELFRCRAPRPATAGIAVTALGSGRRA